MKKHASFFFFLLSVWVGYGQTVVDPHTFTQETNPDNSNFEFYSRATGVNRRATFNNVRKRMTPTAQQSSVAYYPSPTGNTSNLGEVVRDPSGNTWYIDGLGQALQLNRMVAGSGITIAGDTITAADTDALNEAWTIDADDADQEVISSQIVKFQGAGNITTDYNPSTNTLLITGTTDTTTTANVYTTNGTFDDSLRIVGLLRSLWIRSATDTTGFLRLQYGLLKGSRLNMNYDSAGVYFTGGNTLPRLTVKALYSEQAFSDLSGTARVRADSNGVNISTTHSPDRLTITGKDARYAADYSGTYSLRSLVDKAYVDLQDSINDLDYWTEGYTTSTATTSSFTATSSASNITAAIVPKGNGAFTLAVANGSSSGGKARGTKAVDLQIDRNNAAQVASGTSSVVAGGRRNKASASYSAVGGGSLNAASASTAAISGGDSNTASGTAAFVGAGFSNTSSGDYTVTGGGVTNTASGTNATVGGGFSNTASGNSAVIFGGQGNTASGTYSSVPGGYGAEAYLTGQEAHSATFFSTASDAQRSFILLSREITGTAQTELFLDAGAASVRAILKATNRIWNFEVQVVGTCKTVGNGSGITAGDAWVSWHLGGIKRLNTSTSLIGSVQTPATAQSDTGMSTSTVTIDADDTNEALRVRITPPSTAGSTTVTRWIATVKLTEVAY